MFALLVGFDKQVDGLLCMKGGDGGVWSDGGEPGTGGTGEGEECRCGSELEMFMRKGRELSIQLRVRPLTAPLLGRAKRRRSTLWFTTSKFSSVSDWNTIWPVKVRFGLPPSRRCRPRR